jgi:hypothetical protein
MPTVRLRSIRGDWLSVHASPLHGPGGLSTILVLEEPGPGDAVSLILHSRGATGAQAKVVALVLRGYLTKQLVSQLAGHQPVHGPGVPQGGVDKLSVRSRQEPGRRPAPTRALISLLQGICSSSRGSYGHPGSGESARA